MIWVRSRKFVEEVWEPVLPTAVISITTIGDELAVIPEDEAMVPAVLRLQFDDVGKDHVNAMTPEQAEEVVGFIMNLPSPVACVLVHCDAGISRSAGIAAALSKVLYEDDSFFFINYLPNYHVHQQVVTAFYNAGQIAT